MLINNVKYLTTNIVWFINTPAETNYPRLASDCLGFS